MPLAQSAEPSAAVGAMAWRGGALGLVGWLVPFAFLGAVLVHLFPDSYQADAGYHFLFARGSLEHPRFLVDVWGRPLFTALYAIPAQAGYPVAKLLTVAVALAAAWNTARLAQAYGLARPALAIPLLFLQPSFLLICSDTMTEPLFALVLAAALRLHHAGRVRAGMWVAALLPLARPEGFFVALLWGAFVALDPRAGPTFLGRALSTARLAAGVVLWWAVATIFTRDPLFIKHNWPPNWAAGATYGTGPLLQYWHIRDQLLAGPVLQALFALGSVVLVASRRAVLPLATLAVVAVLHSVFFRFGWFGSAGYGRYLVCVAPAMSLAMLAGWNVVAGWVGRVVRRPVPLAGALRLAAGAAVLLSAAWLCLVYVDSWGPSRDARAVDDMVGWLEAHPVPVKRLVYSQAYMAIRLDHDPGERPNLGDDPEREVEILRALPPGTLIFWDAHTGPQYHHIGPAEFERAGYERLHAATYRLAPLLPHWPPLPAHEQELVLYYRP
jgi:hypothetical protein